MGKDRSGKPSRRPRSTSSATDADRRPERLPADRRDKEVLDLLQFQPKIESFGWHVQTINGNDMAQVVDALKKAKAVTDRPTAIVSKTQKGFGILPLLEAEGDINYHGKPLSKALAEKALAFLSQSACDNVESITKFKARPTNGRAFFVCKVIKKRAIMVNELSSIPIGWTQVEICQIIHDSHAVI